MKHYLLLLNNGKYCIADEKELRKAELSAEKYDGFECWGNLGEIDPQKVADNRWTTVKPDFPCLFVAKNMFGICKIYKCHYQNGYLNLSDTAGYGCESINNLTADEYFVIEKL